MAAPEPGRSPETAAELRADIDSGRTGDKHAFPDPAASPLGTDDEAAGTPPDARRVELARETEGARPAAPAHAPVSQEPGTPRVPASWIFSGVAVILVGAAAFLLFAAN